MSDEHSDPTQRQEPPAAPVAPPVVAEFKMVMPGQVGFERLRMIADEPSQPDYSPTEPRPIVTAYASNSAA